MFSAIDGFFQSGFNAFSNLKNGRSLSNVQDLTANIAAVAICTTGFLLLLVTAAKFEHHVVKFISFGHLTTLRAGLINLASPYLLEAAKVTGIIGVSSGALCLIATAVNWSRGK